MKNLDKSMKKCLLWVILIVVSLLVWLIACIGVIWFCNSALNDKIVKSLGGGIDVSNGINLGVALGTIALAIIAWKVYRYATKQYADQKKIDYGIESAKNISGRLFFHKSVLDAPMQAFNTAISHAEIVVKSNAYDDGICMRVFKKKIDGVRMLINDFIDDWKSCIGPDLQLLATITTKEDLLVIHKDIGTEIGKLSIMFDSADKAADIYGVDNLGPTILVNLINKLRLIVVEKLELFLDGT